MENRFFFHFYFHVHKSQTFVHFPIRKVAPFFLRPVQLFEQETDL